jgi:hypothetical protein
MTTLADACSAAVYAQDAAGADVVVGAGVCLTVGVCDFVLLAEPLLTAGPTGIWLGDRRQRIRLAGAFTMPTGPGTPPGRETLKLGFAPLQPGDVSRLGILPVGGDALDLDDHPRSPEYFAVVPDAEHARAPSRAFGLAPASADVYGACGVVPDTHLVGTLDREQGGADLIGCGVWRRTAAGNLLKGVIVDTHPASPDGRPCVVATHPCFCLLGMAQWLGIDPWRPPKARAKRLASVRRPN